MKKSIILLHGALGSKAQFIDLNAILSEYYRVFSFNFEGHGGRLSSENFSMDLFVQNVLDFMAKEGIENSHFFGYSMGGYVALKLALKHPDKVSAIVTLGTKFDWNLATAEREVKMLNPRKIQEKVPRFAQMLEKRHAPDDWKEVMNKTAQMMLDLGNGTAMKVTEFQSIAHPTTILLGERDNMVTQAESQEITQALPNAIFKLIPNFQHPIERVDKQALSTLIKESLDRS